MRHGIAGVVVAFGALCLGVAQAAINPAGFQRVASHRVQVHETARVVHESIVDGHRWRRTTLVGTVVAVHDNEVAALLGPDQRTLVIDYTVDLDARAQALADFQRENGTRPGPQFLAEPDPPVADAEGNYWASVAPAGGRLGNVNRHAGAVLTLDPGYGATGAVFVPVAAQYSFEPPLD